MPKNAPQQIIDQNSDPAVSRTYVDTLQEIPIASTNANIFITNNTQRNYVNYVNVSADAAGSNEEIQFNVGNHFAADSGLRYNASTDSLTVTGNVTTGNIRTDHLLYANGDAWSLGEIGLSITDFGEGFSLNGSDKIVTNKLYSTNETQPTQHYRLELDTNGVVILPDQSIINGSTLRGIYGTGELNYTGITIGPDTDHREESWVWVDYTGVSISTEYSTDAFTWKFDNNGNLILPGNGEISINYANGSSYAGAPVNTGNITFDGDTISSDNNIVNITANGDSNVSSTTLENTCNAGNANIVLSRGQVTINTNNDPVESSWIFGVDGNLSVPANSTISWGAVKGSITDVDDGGYHSGNFIIDSANGSLSTTINRDIRLISHGGSGSSRPYEWNFDRHGNLVVPDNSAINWGSTKGSIISEDTGGLNGQLTISAGSGTSVYRDIKLISCDDNRTHEWKFDNYGNLTFPDESVQTTAYLGSTGAPTLQDITGSGSTTDQAITITNDTESNNKTTGALIVHGGIGANGNIHGTQIHSSGNMFCEGSTLFVGPSAEATEFTNCTILAFHAGAEFVQAAIKNSDPAGTGSADWVAYGQNGTDISGWIDTGFADENFTDASYTVTNPGDGYVFLESYSSTGGNLVLATGELGTVGDIVFATGGFLAENEVVRIVNAAAPADTQLQTQGSVNIGTFLKLTPGTAPSTPSEGTVYYDSTAHAIKVYTGSGWETLAFTA